MERLNGAWGHVDGMRDEALLSELQRLVRADHALSARLLVHLGEVDARGLYRDQACASMFGYAVERLRMSEAQAYLRIQAARLSRRFPVIVQLVEEGALHLTAIKLVGPHLTEENHVQLLERVRGKSKRELEQLVAAIAPKPDVPSCMRKLPETGARARAALAAASGSVAPPTVPSASGASWAEPKVGVHVVLPAPGCVDPLGASHVSSGAVPCEGELGMPVTLPVASHQAQFALQAPRPTTGSVAPLSPGRYKVAFTANQALHDKLEQLKDLLRHQVPDGDLAIIMERAADLLLDKTLKRRFAQTQAVTKPRAIKPRVRRRKASRSRYIPRAVVREVHERDGGRCTFTSPDGRRCGERGFLELHHHDTPFARGGLATVDNLKLVCRVHNALLAERDFGRRFIRSTVQRARLQQLSTNSTRTTATRSRNSLKHDLRPELPEPTPAAKPPGSTT